MPDNELTRNPYLTGGQFNGTLPTAEPAIGSVVAFRVWHPNSPVEYWYAAVRAGNGAWYITGGETKQGVDWPTFIEAIKPRMIGQMILMRMDRELIL